MIRLYVRDALEAGGQVDLSPEQAHYLLHVMRRSPGDAVLLFNGRDGEWRARIANLGKRGCLLDLEAQTQFQSGGGGPELLSALVKRAPLEWIVEKATELGVARIRLVITERTQAERANVARLGAIAVEAAEQTGRLDVPEVRAPEPLARVLEGWRGGTLIFCDEGGEARPMLEGSAGLSEREGVLIGPEGGFSEGERERLQSLPFVAPVSLGPRILRADTAAVAALTLWQASRGDWRDGLPRPI